MVEVPTFSLYSLVIPGLASIGGYGGGLGLGGYGAGLGGYGGGLLGIPVLTGGNLIYGGGLGSGLGGSLGGYGSLRGGFLRREDRALDGSGAEIVEKKDTEV